VDWFIIIEFTISLYLSAWENGALNAHHGIRTVALLKLQKAHPHLKTQ
jgi:hypothetical protein